MKDGDLDKFKSLLQNKSLLTKPDRTGLLPLHKAVILGQTDMIEYLGIKHDDILNLQDNVRIYPTSFFLYRLCIFGSLFAETYVGPRVTCTELYK